MTQMVRKQIYIQKRQETMLKRLAKVRGVSEAEIIREAIDHQIGGRIARTSAPEPEAFAKAYQFMRARRAVSGEQAYQWNRDDAYDERLSRYPRGKPR